MDREAPSWAMWTRAAWLILVSGWVGCSGPPPEVPAPVVAPSASAPVEEVKAPPRRPLRELTVAESHRFFVAHASMDLARPTTNTLVKAISKNLASRVASVDKELKALLGVKLEAHWAEHRLLLCKVSDQPMKECTGAEPKAVLASERADRAAERFEKRLQELEGVAVSDKDPVSAKLTLGWVADVREVVSVPYQQIEESEPPPFSVGFDLGEQVRLGAPRDAYADAAAVVPSGHPLGVLVRERAAAERLARGEAEEALRLLEEASREARGAEATDVAFLIGQARARRAPMAKASLEALEAALAGAPSPHLHRQEIAHSAALAAYRAGDFPRALALALDVDARRFPDQLPPRDPSAVRTLGALSSAALGDAGMIGLIGMLSLDSATRDPLQLAADAVERVGMASAELSGVTGAQEEMLRAELALRALYRGDLREARTILRQSKAPIRPDGPAREVLALACVSAAGAERDLCAQAPEPSAPPKAPPQPRAPGKPESLHNERLRGARDKDMSTEHRVRELVRACAAPWLVDFIPKTRKEPAAKVRLEFEPGQPPTVTTSGEVASLAGVAACLTELAPARLAQAEERIVATIDLTRLGVRIEDHPLGGGVLSLPPQDSPLLLGPNKGTTGTGRKGGAGAGAARGLPGPPRKKP